MRSTPPPAQQIWSTEPRDAGSGSPVLPCGNIHPMGVTGTPTIDPTTGIVYLEAYVQTPSGGPRHKVFGLSLATGEVAPGWPVDVKDGLDALGRGFNNRPQGQRSALTLVNGKLYVPYAGHFGDCGTYNGMVVGLDLATARSVRLLVDRNHRRRQLGTERRRVRRYVHVRDHRQHLQFVELLLGRRRSGDPPADAKLTNPTQDADFFAPANWQTLDQEDLDLGGTSAIPINAPVTPRVLALGKDGNAYLLNRENPRRDRAPNCRDSGVDQRDQHRDGDLPRRGRRQGRLRRPGRGLPKRPVGQSRHAQDHAERHRHRLVRLLQRQRRADRDHHRREDGSDRLGRWRCQATASSMGSAGPTASCWRQPPAAAPRSRDSRPFCGPTAASMWPPTGRSTPSSIRTSGGGSRYSKRPRGAIERVGGIQVRRSTPLAFDGAPQKNAPRAIHSASAWVSCETRA